MALDNFSLIRPDLNKKQKQQQQQKGCDFYTIRSVYLHPQCYLQLSLNY